jgi:hypothetical protein
MSETGTGVNDSTKITAAEKASQWRVRSSGSSSSTTDGWWGPIMKSMTISSTVHSR